MLGYTYDVRHVSPTESQQSVIFIDFEWFCMILSDFQVSWDTRVMWSIGGLKITQKHYKSAEYEWKTVNYQVKSIININARIYMRCATRVANRITIICHFHWFWVILHDFECFSSIMGHSDVVVHDKVENDTKTLENRWIRMRNSKLTSKKHQKHEC